MDTQQKIIIAILMLGTLMGSLDSTIVILAFPSISQNLHADMLTTIWIILIYLLVVAVCTTQLGRLGDIYGRSRMFNTGFGVFTLGSLLCGLSATISFLILSRGIQAFGGALMQANSGAIVADTFPSHERGTAFGYISLGWTSGAMLGIVLGGIITTYFGWEYIFFINIPIGIIATLIGYRYVRDNIRIHATTGYGWHGPARAPPSRSSPLPVWICGGRRCDDKHLVLLRRCCGHCPVPYL